MRMIVMTALIDHSETIKLISLALEIWHKRKCQYYPFRSKLNMCFPLPEHLGLSIIRSLVNPLHSSFINNHY